MDEDGYFGAAIAAGYDDPDDPMNQAAARERWADWNRESLTRFSEKHVSVWEKP